MSQGAAYSLEAFLAECRACNDEFVEPADIVHELAPVMQKLLKISDKFLKPEHLQPNPEHYARNPVYICSSGRLSMFTMVWEPGQWTPVHDHGTWGVVGVVSGSLEERNFIRVDKRDRADSGIILQRGGNLMLSAGSISTFVPNPDHIHRTGVAKGRERAVTLHLYGREMSNYYIYDLELGRRRSIELEQSLVEATQGAEP